MRRSLLLASLLIPCALAMTSLRLHAQFSLVRGAGCPGASSPLWTGNTKLGTTMTLFCPIGSRAETHFGLLGVPRRNFVDLSPPLACKARCKLTLDPLLIQPLGKPQPQWKISIPNQSALIGIRFRLQCASFVTQSRCFDLRGALDVTIVR